MRGWKSEPLGISSLQNLFLKKLPMPIMLSIHCCEETGDFPANKEKKITRSILYMFLVIWVTINHEGSLPAVLYFRIHYFFEQANRLLHHFLSKLFALVAVLLWISKFHYTLWTLCRVYNPWSNLLVYNIWKGIIKKLKRVWSLKMKKKPFTHHLPYSQKTEKKEEMVLSLKTFQIKKRNFLI